MWIVNEGGEEQKSIPRSAIGVVYDVGLSTYNTRTCTTPCGDAMRASTRCPAK